jgi:hypothetical protein
MARPVYYVELFAKKCLIEVVANGLFLTRSNAKNGSSLSYPINTELIGAGNKVLIRAVPTLLDSGELSTIDDIHVLGTIKKYMPDDIIGPEAGELIGTIDLSEGIEQKKVDVEINPLKLKDLFPLSQTIEFDNDDLSFRELLIDGKIIDDKDKVLDYAEYLRDLLAKKDMERLFKEYEPKLLDYKKAYEVPQFDDPADFFIEFMRGDFLPGGPITNFKRNEIGMRKWCDGRIWEVFVLPDNEFFTNTGLDGDINRVEVFVAMVNGSLKIVR